MEFIPCPYPFLLQHDNFIEQGAQRQHHPVADKTAHPFVQDAGRDQVEYRFLSVDNKRMTGIVTALKPDHGLYLLSQQIDDLALAFVTPLGAYNNDGITH